MELGALAHRHRPPELPRLSDRAAEYVRERILSGELAPGEFVRPETVAEEIGVSATPVREGLLQLQSEGLLKSKPRKGFVVADLSPKDISDAHVAFALLIGELYARAATLLTPEQMDELEAVEESFEHAVESSDLDRAEALDGEFHRLVTRAADAPVIVDMLWMVVRFIPHSAAGRSTEIAMPEHRAILHALRSADPDAARAAIADHVQSAGTLLLRRLEGRAA